MGLMKTKARFVNLVPKAFAENVSLGPVSPKRRKPFGPAKLLLFILSINRGAYT